MNSAETTATDASRSWAEIDLEALRHNAAACREAAGPGGEIMAIVKADGYGHGVAFVARALEPEVDGFGVANAAEALELAAVVGSERASQILMLGPALDWERHLLIEKEIALSVSSFEEVAAINQAADGTGRTARLHVNVDTGMGRMGIPENEARALVERIGELPGLRLEGVSSHLPSADEDPEFTREQIGRFSGMVESMNLDPSVKIHVANSAGLFGYASELGAASLARPGLALYGVSPLPEFQDQLKPVLSLKTRVTLVRELPEGASISYGRTFITERPTRVATLGIGYGDGYPRHLSGSGAEVLIGGRRCPLLGRVTMDQIVVDITELESPAGPGAEAVLIGRQGSESISAAELAEKAGTIPWEIFTGLTGRVRRIAG